MKKQDILDLLQRNPKCSSKFLEQVTQEDPKQFDTISSKIVQKAVKQARKVLREFWRLRALTRLDLSDHGILFGEINPEYQIEDLIVKWFGERFPLFIIALESKPRHGVFLYNPEIPHIIFSKIPLNKVITDLEQHLPKNPLLKDIAKFSEELWDRYYASQYIPSRKNFKLFVNRLPRKYLKWSGLSTEARFGNRCLDEFVNKD